jgi:hypothetical protein
MKDLKNLLTEEEARELLKIAGFMSNCDFASQIYNFKQAGIISKSAKEEFEELCKIITSQNIGSFLCADIEKYIFDLKEKAFKAISEAELKPLPEAVIKARKELDEFLKSENVLQDFPVTKRVIEALIQTEREAADKKE